MAKRKVKQTTSKTYAEWKMNLKEVVLQSVECVNVTEDKDICSAFVSMLMNFDVRVTVHR